MNIIIMLVVLLANVIAIGLIYQIIKRLPKKEIIIFIAASVAVTYALVSLIYLISGIGIDESINEAAKDSIVFLFVPLNVIAFIPFIATRYVRYREGKFSRRSLVERIIKIFFIALVVLVLECLYFRHMKNNIDIISKFMSNRNQTVTQVNPQTNSIADDLSTNSIVNSSVETNTVLTNSQTSELSNEVISTNAISD